MSTLEPAARVDNAGMIQAVYVAATDGSTGASW